MSDGQSHPHSVWVNVGKQVLSFVVGVIAAAFILGRNSQRINDVVAWKAQIAPIIERMDSKGTLSFDHFHDTYDKQEIRTEKRLDELEKEIRTIERNKQ
jgi:hypothetical protein